MKKNVLKKLWSVILATMLVAAMSVCAVGCGNTEAPAADETETESVEPGSEDDAEETADDADEADETGAQVSYTTEAITDGAEFGEGDKSFTLEVADEDANVISCVVYTNASTVGEALSDLNLIDGDDSEYGLYVKSVNNMTYSYETDGKYWAFYVDGEYAVTGVDDTEVTDGSTYAFKVE